MKMGEGTDNLQELEDEQYEKNLAEDGGFGEKVSFYDNNPLYDIDEQDEDETQGGDDFSSPFTDYDSSDFDVVSRDEDDGDEVGMFGYEDDEMPMPRRQVFYDDGDSWDEDWDGDDDDDDEDEDDEDEDGNGGRGRKPENVAGVGFVMQDMKANPQKYPDGKVIQIGARKYKIRNNGGMRSLDDLDEEDDAEAQQQAEDDKYNGAIKWRPGQPITVKLLEKVWQKCKKIEKVRPMCEGLNQAVENALCTTGARLTLRAYMYTEKAKDQTLDAVDCMLKLVRSTGLKLRKITASVAEALLFTQDWEQVFAIATFNEPTMNALLALPPVKAVAVPIFTIAVPLINAMERKQKKQNAKKEKS